MAGRIAGITIEIGGDTSNLQKSLKGVDSQLKTTQANLKDIEKLLKMNPASTELLTQKQKALKDAVSQTKDRLQQLKDAQKGVAKGTPEWDALQREIIATEQDLQRAENALRQFGSVTAQQVKAAGVAMQNFGNKVQNVGRELSKISAAAAGALAALAKLGLNAMSGADELNTLSKQTGVSTDELQKWSYASDLVDVSVDTMTGALKKMKKNMDGNTEAFEALGVNVKNADGSFRDTTDVFYDTIEALSNIDNETERDIKAMDIFGKSADELAGVIDDGGAALKQYGKEAEGLGIILDGDTLNQLNEANDTFDRLKATLKGSFGQFAATLATTFAPALEKVAGFLTKLGEKIAKLSPAQAEMIVKILAIVAVIGPLITAIGGIISFIGTLMTVLPLLAGPIGIVIAAIAAVIAITVLVIKNWDKIKAFAIQVWNSVKTTVTNAWNGIKTGVTKAATAVKTFVTNAWNNIKTAVSNAANTAKTNAVNAWNNMKSGISAAMEALAPIVGPVFDSIKSKITSVAAVISGKIQNMIARFNALKSGIQNAIAKIKAVLSGEIKFPNIKLPQIYLEDAGELPWGIGGKGHPPKLGIKWYRQAYDNPILFSSPTVIGTPSGLKGFGDGHGAEIVMGLDKLRELVGGMDQNVTVQVVLEGDARGLFKAVQRTNNVRTKATNYNALAVGG